MVTFVIAPYWGELRPLTHADDGSWNGLETLVDLFFNNCVNQNNLFWTLSNWTVVNRSVVFFALDFILSFLPMVIPQREQLICKGHAME